MCRVREREHFAMESQMGTATSMSMITHCVSLTKTTMSMTTFWSKLPAGGLGWKRVRSSRTLMNKTMNPWYLTL